MANVHKWGLLYGPRFPKSCLHEFYQVLMAVCENWKPRFLDAMRLLSISVNTIGSSDGVFVTNVGVGQVHGGTPVFSVEDGPPPPASPKFTCHLTIPAVHTPHGGFEETRFTAWARSKKAAEHSAAGATPPPPPLTESLKNAGTACMQCVYASPV